MNKYYIDTIEKCGVELLEMSDDDIEYSIFEEFDICFRRNIFQRKQWGNSNNREQWTLWNKMDGRTQKAIWGYDGKLWSAC